MIGVVLFIAKTTIKTNEVKDFCIIVLENILNKRRNRFYVHTLAET